MGLFDWLFGKSEKNIVDDKIKSKSDNILIENIMFKNVKGIDFDKVSLAPKGDSPETFLTSDIDGLWYYAQNQMVMLFKAFSIEKFDLSLKVLLDANNLKYENYVEKNTIKYWYANDFKIEVPPALGQAQLILITNEDIVPVDSLEFQKTDLTDVTYDLDWVEGFTIYDGYEILKKDYQFGKSLNVPAYFNEHGHEYVLIKVTTETIAKNLVDKIIENNGGKKKFKADSVDGWFYPHKTDCFTVGFLIEHSVVRINKLLSPKSKGILTTDLIPEVELPENLKIHGIEHVYDFDKIADINLLLHVPLLGTDSRMNNGQMIFIRSTTKELCKTLVDEIIEKNGGKENFEDVTKLATIIFGSMSEYFFQNDSFSILILPQYPAVRINLFTEGGYSKFKDIEV